MKQNEEIVKRARTHFDEGFNCAESVLLAGAEFFKKESPDIPRLATPFGGGLSGNGYACGAITGGLMVIGLCRGRDDAADLECKRKVYDLSDRFLKAFKKRFDSVNCRDLSGVDFKSVPGVQKYKKSVHAEVCAPIVEFVAEWLGNNLNGEKGEL